MGTVLSLVQAYLRKFVHTKGPLNVVPKSEYHRFKTLLNDEEHFFSLGKKNKQTNRKKTLSIISSVFSLFWVSDR